MAKELSKDASRLITASMSCHRVLGENPVLAAIFTGPHDRILPFQFYRQQARLLRIIRLTVTLDVFWMHGSTHVIPVCVVETEMTPYMFVVHVMVFDIVDQACEPPKLDSHQVFQDKAARCANHLREWQSARHCTKYTSKTVQFRDEECRLISCFSREDHGQIMHRSDGCGMRRT